MNSRIIAGTLISLAVLFLGAAMVQGAEDGESAIDSDSDIEIAITDANFAATSPEKEHLDEEWVEISNLGSEDFSLAGCTLSDAQNHCYSFPDITLRAGAKVKIHTGMGSDASKDLFWCRSSSIWNNDGDVATLKDASGNTISCYPEQGSKA